MGQGASDNETGTLITQTYLLAAVAVHQGRDAWRGDGCC